MKSRVKIAPPRLYSEGAPAQPVGRRRPQLSQRRLRVLHVINDLSVGGAEMMLYKLLSDRDAERFVPAVASLRSRGLLRERVDALDVGVHSVGINSHLHTPAAAFKLAGIVRRLDPDVIHGWMYHGNLAAQFAAACAPRSVPVLWSIRQSIYSLEHEKTSTMLAIRLGARLSSRPDAIVYNSRVSAAQHGAIGYLAEKGRVIPNGFDTSSFAPSDEARRGVRAELGLDEDALLVGMVGRFHPAKDHETFLRAASLVNQTEREVRFVLCGRGVEWENQQLRGLAARLGVAERTHLLGERHDMQRLTASFDLVVSSSFEEGFPNVVGEAMSCGVPCVVTDVSDLPWVVGDTGLVVPPKDPDALARAMRTMIEMSPEGRRQMGESARRRVVNKFQLKKIKELYEDLYAELAAKRENGTRGARGVRKLFEAKSATAARARAESDRNEDTP
ncbi:MAG TPA: glycosyltransferase [Pyrinomonadaceae bacterium]|nr:glycosyltransferase [Pyrinomonadaceae bacterium]